jgi:ribonuclease VapC
VVVDTSAVLAVLFNESQGLWVAEKLGAHAGALRMSTVSYAEVLILLRDRQPHLFEDLRNSLLSATIRFVPPSKEQAEIAARARLQFPLNLGDCFAYALAKEEGCPILTLDADFRKTDLPVVIPDPL